MSNLRENVKEVIRHGPCSKYPVWYSPGQHTVGYIKRCSLSAHHHTTSTANRSLSSSTERPVFFSTMYVSSLLLLLHLPPSHLPPHPSLRRRGTTHKEIRINVSNSVENTELRKVVALKLGVGLSIALHASPTVRTSARFLFFQLFFKHVVACHNSV